MQPPESQPPAAPAESVEATEHPSIFREGADFRAMSLIVNLGWLGTNIGLAITNLPVRYLLKDQLHLAPPAVSAFLALGVASNYVKPVAGLLTDSFPLFGTRRRHYLLVSLLATALLWMALAWVPRSYTILLVTYFIMYTGVMFTSTTLGGVMVELGHRFKAEGRLTAQRIACFRIGSLIGDPIGGWLVQTFPFWVATAGTSTLHLMLVPLFYFSIREPKGAKRNMGVWTEAKRQLIGLVRNRVVMAAAGMIFLIAVAPGFNTPLFFYQTNTLGFRPAFIGTLSLISAATGFLATVIYFTACRRVKLKKLIIYSIALHAVGDLLYLYYSSQATAMIISATSGITVTLAMLPVYDLATRGTPKGSEALGYSVMMSVWNLTNSLSDFTGSLIFSKLGIDFHGLVWLNAGTTALALAAVPFLPFRLTESKDGD